MSFILKTNWHCYHINFYF